MTPEQRATVLIVEDDVGVARLVRARLKRTDTPSSAVTTAEAGMEWVRGGGVDLLVLDQQLPGGVSGLQLYERVKAAGFDVPAILATGFSDEATMLQAIRAGVRDFVPKTADYLNYLTPAVARVIKEVRTERELTESRARAGRRWSGSGSLRRRSPSENWPKRSAKGRRKRCGTRTGARTSSWRCWPTSCATRWPRSATPCRSCGWPDVAPGTCDQTREMMERQVQLMARLVDDLLDVSRITRGKIELRKEPVELATVVARAVETARPLIEARPRADGGRCRRSRCSWKATRSGWPRSWPTC